MDHHDTLQRTRNKTAHRILINTVVLIYHMQAIIGCVVIAARSSIVTSSHTARHTRHNDIKKNKKKGRALSTLNGEESSVFYSDLDIFVDLNRIALFACDQLDCAGLSVCKKL